MSAFMVNKAHVDLLVKACSIYKDGSYQGAKFSWFPEDGRRSLERGADGTEYERVSFSQLGQILVSENAASVGFRYSEPGRTLYYGADVAATMEDDTVETLPGPVDRFYMAPYVYSEPAHGRILTPGEVFKAIDCLTYQSCEHDDWETSEAHQILERLRHNACARVDGYDDAPWDFS